jgi:HAMP domain-containing protein
MKLKAKFNVVILAIFSVGLLVTGYLSYAILHANAHKDAVERATLVMEAATAVQAYTQAEVEPLLAPHMGEKFLPQSVAAYAAIQALNKMGDSYSDYSYKAAALNPTNPRDKAFEWEADVVEEFRAKSARKEIVGVRPTTHGDSLYLARPIKITNKACLDCHGSPATAPKALLTKYGPANGFGWKLNEIIGAQIVSVPLGGALREARLAFVVFMGLLVVMFATFIIVLNAMLKSIVIRPATTMSEIADKVSKGDLEVPAFDVGGKDEMATLAGSFNRMRRSVERAMRMLDK